MKVLVVLIFISLNVHANTVTRLYSCKDTCECEAPMVSAKEQFVFAPSNQKQNVLACHLSTDDIKTALDCVSNMGKNIISCGERGASSNGSNACDNLSTKFYYPETYLLANKAPKNCGYEWKNFNVSQYRGVVRLLLKEGKVACTKSMCTSAAFLALVEKAKALYRDKKISKAKFEELTTPYGAAYKILNNNAEPNELFEKYGLGSGHVIYPAESKSKEWKIPQAGDITQIWRKNNSGHSVVFKGFLDKNGDGKNDHICYWSSQTRTNGYGNVCEKISDVDRILVGHFHD